MKHNYNKGVISVIFLTLLLSSACGNDKPVTDNPVEKMKTYEHTVSASSEKVVRFYEAAGTIRPETEASIEAQIRAQIKDMLVAPGTEVLKGQPLVKLDDLQYASMLDRAKEGLSSAMAVREQAKQALEASKAAFSQAESSFKRIKKFHASQAATDQQLESAESAWKQARAGKQNSIQALRAAESGIKQARELVKQAQIRLGYTIIKAPADGVVLKKTADAGDIALPGKPLLLVRTNSMLRIEASVREGLIKNILIGQKLDVEIKNLDLKVKAIVDEIEPFADPQTRTFLVKAALPEIHGIYPGMYGKLLIPEKTEDAVILTPEAIKKVGQLRYVNVKEEDRWQRRFITTGGEIGDMVEVLSGLQGNETIGY